MTRGWDDKQRERTPKTKSASRHVPIVPALDAALRAHQTRTKRSGSDLVFGRTALEPFTPSTPRSRALSAWKAADAAKAKSLGRDLEPGEGLEPVGLHECRHTFASLSIASGANAKALSVVMGHSDIGTTFNTYGHLMPDGEQEVGRLLGQYLATTD